MRASRLLTILMTLQARGRATARELAEECEVAIRTIYRDIDALSLAGVPVYADRGAEGGYRLLDGYKTRVNGLTPQEAEALFLGGLPGAAADLGLGAVMAAAQLKLLAALPAELRRSAETMRMRFHLDAPGWFSQADQVPHLPQLTQSVWNQTPVRIRYQSWTKRAVREIEPLGVVLKSGLWYLVAAVDGSLRTYRVSRILELELADGRFERPADFDLGAYWAASAARYEASLYKGHMRVRFSPQGFERLSWSPMPGVDTAAKSASAPDAEGWREVRLPIESLDQATAAILRFGPDVEVLEPAELREQVRESALATTRIYA
jgi:predicted DNA-binding transcriptional regulator YafY